MDWRSLRYQSWSLRRRRAPLFERVQVPGASRWFLSVRLRRGIYVRVKIRGKLLPTSSHTSVSFIGTISLFGDCPESFLRQWRYLQQFRFWVSKTCDWFFVCCCCETIGSSIRRAHISLHFNLNKRRNPRCDCGPRYYGQHCEFTKSLTAIPASAEEELLSRGGLATYLFFIFLGFAIFCYFGWRIYRNSKILAERKRCIAEESQLQVQRKEPFSGVTLDDIQML